LILENRVEFLETVLACAQIGASFAPINFHLRPQEARQILADYQPDLVVVDDQTAPAIADQPNGTHPPHDPNIANVDQPLEHPTSFLRLSHGKPAHLPKERMNGTLVLYTSGTTGSPKAVVPPRHSTDLAEAIQRSVAWGKAAGWSASDVHLVQGPLYHAGPYGYSVMTLHLGGTIVLLPRWTAEAVIDRIERYQVTTAFMVPTMLRRLLDLPAAVRRRRRVESLRSIILSAAPCPPSLKRSFIDWVGPIVYEVYGGAESPLTMISSEDWLKHPGSVGRAKPPVHLTVLNDSFETCAPGEIGTIYFRLEGTGLPMYRNDPQKTASQTHGDHFTLGDMGHVDEDGWLFLADRRTDLIISGGVNIYPAEIEAVLADHEEVFDVAVIGVPHPDWGEQVKAVVQPKAMTSAGPRLAQSLLDLARAHLAPYKCPKSIDFRAELPRTPTGKLYKRLLKEEYLTRSTAVAEGADIDEEGRHAPVPD
jgi:long-chain acyl-CoA synthetase